MSQQWQDRLQQADARELHTGYTSGYGCLFCEHAAKDEPEAKAHLQQAHGSALQGLLALPKKYTGLTDRQKELLLAWSQGVPDTVLAERLGNSPSTLRNQRFALREHARQAQLFLAALSLSGLDQEQRKPRRKDGIDQFFREGRLLRIPVRAKPRLAALQRISQHFDVGKSYTELQVNEGLQAIYEDFVSLRREMVDAGLLARTPNGSRYWKPVQDAEKEEEEPMPIDKKAAKKAYKNTITPMGVYRILDRQTGRYLLGADRNLGSSQNRFQFMMMSGRPTSAGPFSDPQMFADYQDHPDAFTFEVVAEVDLEKHLTYEEAAYALDKLYAEQAPLFPEEQRYRTK